MDPNANAPLSPPDDAPNQEQGAAETPSRYPAPGVVRGHAAPTQPVHPQQPPVQQQPPAVQQPPVQQPPQAPKQPAPRRATPPSSGSTTKPELTEAEIAQEKRTRALVLRFALLLLAAVLASSLPLPGLVVAVPLIAGVIWTGISLLRRPKRPGAPTWTTFTVVGFGVTAMISLGVVTSIATWNARIDYQTCMDRALTNSAQTQCQAEYTERITGAFGSAANFG